MSEPDHEGNGHVQRDQTNESLRVEREKVDAIDVQKRDAIDAQADAVVQLARDRADQVVERARSDVDGATSAVRSPAQARQERARADSLLERERSDADASLQRERAQRRRYLADFLTVERDATDQDLLVERAHADTAVVARDAFLATVSHDLRSLLGGLAMNAKLVLRHAPGGTAGDELRGYAARSERLVARMSRLVNDLLDVASIEAGRLALFPERVDVARLLRETLDAFEPIAAAKRITLDANVARAPIDLWLDEGRILQVLANLVGNAIKFTQVEGRVSIEVLALDAEVQFAVNDTGIGIPAEAQGGVFERLSQVNKDPRGLGLGLHISKSIVEAHGGRVWVESRPGVGSTFRFALPSGDVAG